MKIKIDAIDRESFNVVEHNFHGEPVFLVTPQHIGCKWTKHNLNFRSSVWNADGELVSASFPKFFNWGEHPELTPPPRDLSGAHLIEKIDGSTLIVSHYNGHVMVRTRGTINAVAQENGAEVWALIEKYPLAFNPGQGESWLFEWGSPSNCIVIKHPEPELYMIGSINQKDYSLYDQDLVDRLAKAIKVKRPQTFSFNTVEEMLIGIQALKGQEGTCVYYNDDQNILKVKSEWYLALHRFKEHLNLEAILDLFLEYGMPCYQNFIVYMEKAFDFECMQMARPFASQICDAMKEVRKIVEHMEQFVVGLQGKSRKEQALKIMEAYGKTSRASFVFTLLDGKTLEKKDYKKLLFQVMK